MNQDKVMNVVFRKEGDRNNNIIAVFSEKFNSYRKDKLMFSLIDGHCSINNAYYVESTKPCKDEKEYGFLKDILENEYGYKLKIVDRLYWR